MRSNLGVDGPSKSVNTAVETNKPRGTVINEFVNNGTA